MNPVTLPFADVLRRHPAFVLTALYLAVSAIGLMFSWAFFRRFDVNYFVFADVTDFLLAALREPVSIVAGAGGVLLMTLLYWYADWEVKVIGARPSRGRLLDFYYRMNRGALGSPWFTLAVLFLYMFLLVAPYAEWRADVFERGDGPEVEIVIGDADPEVLQLMGSSARFLFLHDARSGRTLVVPDEAVTTLTVIGPAAAAAPSGT